MEHFKKKTIALILASVVTVVGSFAANNYRNSLMGLSFEPTSSGNINMIVQTKTAYSGNVTPIRKDANTFVLMLPEVNSLAQTPNLSNTGNISSVNIRTMPYSNTAKGYTKITIKTSVPSLQVSGRNQIFIPDSTATESNYKEINQNNSSTEQVDYAAKQEEILRRQEEKQIFEQESTQFNNELQAQTSSYAEDAEPSLKKDVNSDIAEEQEDLFSQETEQYTNDSAAHSYYFLWAILIILGCVFFYIKAKNKMTEIAGEKLEIDVEDEEKPKKQRKTQQKISKIKNTINTLDNAYSKTSGLLDKSVYNKPQLPPVKKVAQEEDLNIVDLDKLFEEQKTKSQEERDEENAALEEFLSGFSFDEELYEAEQREEVSVGYNEELYNKIISKKDLIFSKNDINRINKLLGTEINDDTMRDINKYAVTSPIKAPSKEKILENLIMDYTITQNVSFTKEDVDALYKIINVEIDKDFITDLRTNPTKIAEMQKDILEYGDKPKKPSEIITLSVSEMLPDLSEALRKQGNKKIESAYKAETVYFSEGYDVKTLSLSDKLPDLTKELNRKDAFASKPSAKYDIVDSNYTVGESELKISSELPDLQDALEHPEKYFDSIKKDVIVDEQALLDNISNVRFKPFDDGTREFEVLNNFEEVPSVVDIQKELSQFEGFEIAQEEHISPKADNNFDDFKTLYDNEFVDLDNKEKSKKEKFPLKSDEDKEPVHKYRKNLPENVLSRINASRNEYKNKKLEPVKQKTETNFIPVKCLLDGESFSVVSAVTFSDNKGCYLAKNENGYVIISYIENTLAKIKEYSELKSEKIQARLSEKLEDGTQRFLIRIGLNKFIVDVLDDQIRYVMDLC